MLGKQLGLIVELAAPNISIDFLQADDVWRLSFEDRQNSFQPIPSIDAADPLVDVVADQPDVILRFRFFPC